MGGGGGGGEKNSKSIVSFDRLFPPAKLRIVATRTYTHRTYIRNSSSVLVRYVIKN